MFEVEIKARLETGEEHPDPGQIGANFQTKARHKDVYFNLKQRNFYLTDEAVRVRIQEADRTDIYLTYKGPKLDKTSKTREELEVMVKPASEKEKPSETALLLEHMLRKLDLFPVFRVVKHRQFYSLPAEHENNPLSRTIIISLDEVEGLGKFVEIETYAENAEEISDLTKGCHKVMNKLGLGMDRNVRKSYLELLLENSGKKQNL